MSEQEVVEELLVGADQSAQLSGDGEGDQIIRQRQESATLSVQPRGGIGVATLRTGPMVAGVISKVELAAIAAEQLAAQRGSAAADNGGDGASMGGEQPGAKLPLIRRPVPAQDFGQCDHRPERLGFERLVESSQSGLGAGLADRGQMGVDGDDRLEPSSIVADKRRPSSGDGGFGFWSSWQLSLL